MNTRQVDELTTCWTIQAVDVLRVNRRVVSSDERIVDRCNAIGPSLSWVVLNIGIRDSAENLGLQASNIWAHRGPDVDAQFATYETDAEHRPLPAYFLTAPSAKDPQWTERYPDRSTIDIAGVTSWALFEPFADTAWKRRGAEYDSGHGNLPVGGQLISPLAVTISPH